MLPKGPSYEPPGVLQDPLNKQHKLITTAVKGSNGKRLRVRCKCMAEYKNVSDRYVNYDHLADVDSLEKALQVYENHLAASRLLTIVEMFHQGLVEEWGKRRDEGGLRDSNELCPDEQCRKSKVSKRAIS